MDKIERWTHLAGPSRAALLEPLRERLEDPIEPPDEAAESIDPVRRLVRMGNVPGPGDRRHLTIAKDFAERYGFDGESSCGTGNVGEAEALVIHLVTAELLEPRGRNFRPSKGCAVAAGEPVRLWELVADSLLTSYYVFASQPELAIAAMARRTLEGVIGRQHHQAALEAVIVENRPTSGSQAANLIGTTCSMTATLCRGLRMIVPDAGGVDSAVLTPGGLPMALRALRAAALSDARYMWALEEAGEAGGN